MPQCPKVGERFGRDLIGLRRGDREVERPHLAHLIDGLLVGALEVALGGGLLRLHLRRVGDRDGLVRMNDGDDAEERGEREDRNDDGEADPYCAHGDANAGVRGDAARHFPVVRSRVRCAAMARPIGELRVTRSIARTVSRRMYITSTGWWSSLPRFTSPTGRSVVTLVASLR